MVFTSNFSNPRWLVSVATLDVAISIKSGSLKSLSTTKWEENNRLHFHKFDNMIRLGNSYRFLNISILNTRKNLAILIIIFNHKLLCGKSEQTTSNPSNMK